MPIMDEFLEATPTAELLPLSAGVQSDEEVSRPLSLLLMSHSANMYGRQEMGLRYDQLSEFG